MSSIIVTADVVGSTEAKLTYGQSIGISMIRAALESFREHMARVDPKLVCPAPPAGDNILLIGGEDAVEIYHASLRYQADFIAVPDNRMPLKITIGFGHVPSFQGRDGLVGHHSTDLDLISRINEFCPPGGVLVTASMFAILHERGFGSRFHACREKLKSFGRRVFYESNGFYRPPKGARQRYLERGRNRFWPQTESARVSLATILWMALLTLYAVQNAQ